MLRQGGLEKLIVHLAIAFCDPAFRGARTLFQNSEYVGSLNGSSHSFSRIFDAPVSSGLVMVHLQDGCNIAAIVRVF